MGSPIAWIESLIGREGVDTHHVPCPTGEMEEETDGK